MELILGILAFMVATLAVLQGYQIVNNRRKNSNPGISDKLSTIISQLSLIHSRVEDIWKKLYPS